MHWNTEVSLFYLNSAPVLFSHSCGLQKGLLAAGCRLWQDGALLADPTAWQSVHSIACGSPLRNQSATAHLFYYLVKPEYFIATDKAPGRRLHAKLLGVRGSSSPASPLSHLQNCWGKGRPGWALRCRKHGTAALGVTRGCSPQLRPECT